MAMKWNDPNNKKPSFHIRHLLFQGGGGWQPGYLKQINETADGNEYIWMDIDGHQIANVTHYLVVEPPKNNQ